MLEENDKTIEGRNPVTEALISGMPIDKILISDSANKNTLGKLIKLARDRGVPYSFVNSKKVESISLSGSSQGVIAFVSSVSYSTLEDILAAGENNGSFPFIIIADEITDPHNLGALIRTANAVGADGVIIPKHRSAGINAVVAKTSAGAVCHTMIAKVTSIPKLIDELKERGIWIFGMDAKGEKSIYDADLKCSCAIVIGAEGKGLGRLVRDKCDFLLNIPMKGKTESLNASVAGALVMYETMRQRSFI